MTLKVRILQSLTRLFIILVNLTKTGFSEEMLISIRCLRGFMPNLLKKSLTVSSKYSFNEDYEGSGYLKTYGVGNQGYVFFNHCLKSPLYVGYF